MDPVYMISSSTFFTLERRIENMINNVGNLFILRDYVRVLKPYLGDPAEELRHFGEAQPEIGIGLH